MFLRFPGGCTGIEFHFFSRKGISLPIFVNGGELKFSEGIKKKHFSYFTIFNFIISINTNVTKFVSYENYYVIM